MGIQQTPKTFTAGAYVSVGISFSFRLSELPEVVQPLIPLCRPASLCSAFGSHPNTNTLNDVVHVGVVSNATVAMVPDSLSPNETLCMT